MRVAIIEKDDSITEEMVECSWHEGDDKWIEINKKNGCIELLAKVTDCKFEDFIGHLPDDYSATMWYTKPQWYDRPHFTPEYTDEYGFTRALMHCSAKHSEDRGLKWDMHNRNRWELHDEIKCPASIECFGYGGRVGSRLKMILGEHVTLESKTHGGHILRTKHEMFRSRLNFMLSYGYEDSRTSCHGFSGRTTLDRGLPLVRFTTRFDVFEIQKSNDPKIFIPWDEISFVAEVFDEAVWMVKDGPVPFGRYWTGETYEIESRCQPSNKASKGG